MKTYFVTFDMNENCTNYVEVSMVATYVVCTDEQHSFFNIVVEADSGKEAVIVAALYVKKFIMDEACNLADNISNMAMENY